MAVELAVDDCDAELLADGVASEEPEAEDDEEPLLDEVDEGGAVVVLVDGADVLEEAEPEDEGD